MKIKSTKPFVSEFNGTPITLAKDPKTDGDVIGTSGETKMYNLPNGRALYLEPCDIED